MISATAKLRITLTIIAAIKLERIFGKEDVMRSLGLTAEQEEILFCKIQKQNFFYELPSEILASISI